MFIINTVTYSTFYSRQMVTFEEDSSKPFYE